MAIVKMGAQDEASEIKFDSSSTNLTQTNLQGVIEELNSKIGTIQFNGDGWKDNVSVLTDTGDANTRPAYYAIGESSQYFCYHFADNKTQFLQSIFHINHDIKQGTPMYPHIHWFPSSTSTGVVLWELECNIIKGHGQGDVLGAISKTYTRRIFVNGNGLAYEHMVAEVDDVDALPYSEPDSIVVITLKRIGQDPLDTFVGDAGAMMVDLHYQSDRETTPNKVPDFYA